SSRMMLSLVTFATTNRPGAGPKGIRPPNPPPAPAGRCAGDRARKKNSTSTATAASNQTPLFFMAWSSFRLRFGLPVFVSRSCSEQFLDRLAGVLHQRQRPVLRAGQFVVRVEPQPLVERGRHLARRHR